MRAEAEKAEKSKLRLSRGYHPAAQMSTAGFWATPDRRFFFHRRWSGLWTIFAFTREDHDWLCQYGIRHRDFRTLSEAKQRFNDAALISSYPPPIRRADPGEEA